MTSPARFTKSEIFTAYNLARADARRAGDTKRVERLNKALGILLSTDYYTGEKVEYQSTYFSCGCKDWHYRHAARRAYHGPCKHMMAAALVLDMLTRRASHLVALPAEILTK